MKKQISLVLSLAMMLALLVACSGETSTVKGQGDGFGGVISATVTLKDGTLSNVVFEGSGETPTIGGVALETLAAEMKKAGSPDVDAVSGATITSNGAIYAVKNAMDATANPYPRETAERVTVQEPPTAIGAISGLTDGLRIGQVNYAAHGDKGFAVTTVALNGETVIDVYIDEYQFQSNAVAVPNSDASFGDAYAGDAQMASKRANNEAYSANMADHANATVSYLENILAIEAFVTGKTVSELKIFVDSNDAAAARDAVSGATLVDTRGYMMSVLAAAEDAAKQNPVTYAGDATSLRLGRIEGAAHGDKAFTIAAALTDGSTVVLSYLDEFQTTTPSDAIIGVPGSNGGFGEGFGPESVLISKRYNNDYYSGLMTSNAGATVSIADNYDAIQNYCNGKSISELEPMAVGEGIDAVSGATLVDTANYIQTIIDAAKSA